VPILKLGKFTEGERKRMVPWAWNHPSVFRLFPSYWVSLRIRNPPEMSRTPAPSIVRVILPPVLGSTLRIPLAMPPRDVPLTESPPGSPLPEPPLPGNETLARNVASS